MALNEGPGRSTSEVTGYIAWAVQGAKNIEGTSFYFAKHLNGSGYDVETETSNEHIGGSGKLLGLVYKTAVKADGSIVTYGWADGFGRLLTAALGNDAVAVRGNVGEHVIMPTGATLPYLTIDQTWADETERVTNCLLSDLKIEGEAGKPVKLSAQFIAGGTPYVRNSALTITREAGPPLMIPGASALWSTYSNESGTPAETAEITKWSLDVKNTLDDGIRTLSLFREDVVWNMVDLAFDCTIKYVDRTAWNNVHYGGGTQVPVAIPTGQFSFFTQGNKIASGTVQSCYMVMPNLFISNSKVNRLDPDGKTMFVDYTAFGVGGQSTAPLVATLFTSATTAYTATAT